MRGEFAKFLNISCEVAILLGSFVRDLAVLFLHLLTTAARLAGPGGARSVVAESLLVKQQLLILNRSLKRSPRLRLSDRIIAGFCALLMRPRRLLRSAIVLKPSTLFSLHRALSKRKYHLLFSSDGHPNWPSFTEPKAATAKLNRSASARSRSRKRRLVPIILISRHR